MRKHTPGTSTSFNSARNRLAQGSTPSLNWGRKTHRAVGGLYKAVKTPAVGGRFSPATPPRTVAHGATLLKLKCFY